MNQSLDTYLCRTPMLDFEHPQIQALIDQHSWQLLPTYEAIGRIYHFVRDDVLFGYNADDRLRASDVLSDGYGQCNTKGTLLIALLRAVGIPARLHGFTIYNTLQKGAIPHYLFKFAPEKILHSWVEVYYQDQWIDLEGYIIDSAYLSKIQQRFADTSVDFSGYGIATTCLACPNTDWQGKGTYIQKEGIADDFGVFDQPDDFYRLHGSNLSGVKKWLFKIVLRHLMNLNVQKIRRRGLNRCAQAPASSGRKQSL